MKITVNLWVFFVVAGILTLQVLTIAKIISENNRLSDNFNAVMQGVQYFRLNDSLQTARTERILIDQADIKQHFPTITRHIRQLDMKLSQLERYSSLSLDASYQLAGRLRDTVHLKETIIQDRVIRDTVKLQYTRYKDKWIDFQQAIVADSAYTSIRTRDSIAIVQSWERPKKCWFIRYGKKKHTQRVTSFNPHATITHSLYIEKK